MSAIIIVGGKPESREKKVAEIFKEFKSQPIEKDLDTHILGKETSSLGINEIRELERSLSLKAYGHPPKFAIIYADKLTFEAQTALLKSLEEPSGDSVFLLIAPNLDFFLPTILSRCQIVNLPTEVEIQISEEERKIYEKEINDFISASAGKRISLLQNYWACQNRIEAEKFCQIQLLLWREKLLKSQSQNPPNPSLNHKTCLTVLKSIQQTIRYLKANVNCRLALENLVLRFPSVS